MRLLAVAIAVAVFCALVARWLDDALGRRAAFWLTSALVVSMLGVPGALLARPALRPAAALNPLAVDYRGSDSCRPCHLDHYDTWHATYHRTMTQEPSREAIRGRFDGETRILKGEAIRPWQSGTRFAIDIGGKAFDVDRVVGSHEHQVYLSKDTDGRYRTLPLEWNLRHGRWVTSDASFLAPETSLWGSSQTWNTNCAPCHNTRAVPGRTQAADGAASWNTSLAEMGIACEACHGPGEQHEALNRNPMRRVWLALRGQGDPTIVNPARLSQQDSVRACGRCHGKWWPKGVYRQRWLTSGEIYRPGSWGLERYYRLGPTQHGAFRDEGDGGWWWPDGTPRASAMEYQGVLRSPCFERGTMTCVSCHSMHGTNPDDQLIHVDDPTTPAHEADRACTQCHRVFEDEAKLVAHTHHERSSEGSRCVACHMPYQTWGILKAIRSHRISSPSAVATAATRIPNGCNDCHVDRTLAWTAEQLRDWYGQPIPELRDTDRRIASTIVDLLEGNALSRALAATSLGRPQSLPSSSVAWRAPFLAFALTDPYPAVRWAGLHAIRALPGYEQLDFDHLAEPDARLAHVQRLLRGFTEKAKQAKSKPAAVPLDSEGYPEREVASDLLSRQSTVKIAIHE